MPRPVLDQVNIVVTDMEAALAFYRRLGLEIPDPRPPWSNHHVNAKNEGAVDVDFDSAEFASMWGQDEPRPVLNFRFDEREAVDATYADLTGAGYEGRRAPYDAFWGARFAIVVDPDGNAVGLTSPVDRAFASPPPDITLT